MGLFDMFGAGGGRLQIQPQSPHVSAGASLAGTVGFQGGSRPQQITKITLKLVMDQTQVQHTPQGPQQRTQSRDVIPAFPLAAAFTSTPGQVHQFGFDFATVSIERDGEGRATSMTCAGAEAKLTRDRAGRVLSIALGDGRVIAGGEPWQLGPIDGGRAREILRWSPDAARALLMRCESGLGVDDLDAVDALSAHVGVVLAHARALGLRVEPE